jgi:ubiquitin-protein ligase
MTSRLRRLNADYDLIQRVFAAHPFVRLVMTEGTPPEKYTFALQVEGLTPTADDAPTPCRLHQVEVFLPMDYPRCPPFCRMTTPVFHPNIDPQKICIGDHWSAGQSLAHMVIHIAEMLCYQRYNLKSPLNARAAAWADQHLEMLPLQKVDLSGGL